MSVVVTTLSGGLDSVTLAHALAADGHDLIALSFDYGQRHAKELDPRGSVRRPARGGAPRRRPALGGRAAHGLGADRPGRGRARGPLHRRVDGGDRGPQPQRDHAVGRGGRGRRPRRRGRRHRRPRRRPRHLPGLPTGLHRGDRARGARRQRGLHRRRASRCWRRSSTSPRTRSSAEARRSGCRSRRRGRATWARSSTAAAAAPASSAGRRSSSRASHDPTRYAAVSV